MIIIIILACYTYSGKVIEGFASGKTNIVYSNRVIDDSSDKYANINQEILVLTQEPGKDRNTPFQYFRGPFYNYMAIYSRKLNDKGVLTNINITLVQITEQNYDIVQLLGKNKALINDNYNQIKYYIKVLDKESYADEVKKARIRQINLNNYIQCINLKKLTNTHNVAISHCKSQFEQV